MMGLALMAHDLAVKRTGYDGMFLCNEDGTKRPGVTGKHFGRKYWADFDDLSSTTATYYHIIRRLEAGDKA